MRRGKCLGVLCTLFLIITFPLLLLMGCMIGAAVLLFRMCICIKMFLLFDFLRKSAFSFPKNKCVKVLTFPFYLVYYIIVATFAIIMLTISLCIVVVFGVLLYVFAFVPIVLTFLFVLSRKLCCVWNPCCYTSCCKKKAKR